MTSYLTLQARTLSCCYSGMTSIRQPVLRAERRLAMMGAILSAVILESHFRPKLLTKQHMQGVFEELYEADPCLSESSFLTVLIQT